MGELLSFAVPQNAKHLSIFHLLYHKVPVFPRGDSAFLVLLISLLLKATHLSTCLPASRGHANVHSGTLAPRLHMHKAKQSEHVLIMWPHAESSGAKSARLFRLKTKPRRQNKVWYKKIIKNTKKYLTFVIIIIIIQKFDCYHKQD